MGPYVTGLPLIVYICSGPIYRTRSIASLYLNIEHGCITFFIALFTAIHYTKMFRCSYQHNGWYALK